MKTKRIWLVPTLLLAIVASATLVWKKAPTPQIITLPNGQQIRYAGVTYGTNHLQGTAAARLIHRLPAPVETFLKKHLGSRLGPINSLTTPEPTLVVWFEPLGTNTANTTTTTYAMLAEESGALSGERQRVFYSLGLASLHYRIVPRRSRILGCVFFEDKTNRDYRELGRVRFPNPSFAEHPQWRAESLPATKAAGDVKVRLDSFTTGRSSYAVIGSFDGGRNVAPRGRPAGFQPAKPGDEVLAGIDLTFLPDRADELWTLKSVEFTDATGNRARINAPGRSWNHFVAPALWPEEAAWKAKLEIKRTGGLSPDEIVKFAGVRIPPPGQTNALSLTQDSGGLEIKLSQIARRPDTGGGPSWGRFEAYTRIEHTKIPEDVVLDFVEATANDGRKLDLWFSIWSDHSSEFFLRSVPIGIESVDITFSIQRTRTVEFMVKPVIAK